MSNQITNQQISAIKARKACLLDVRSLEEHKAERSKYALSKDVHDLASGEIPNLPKNMPIFTFCRSGNRSELAKHLLESKGFTNVTNIGSYNDLPLELK